MNIHVEYLPRLPVVGLIVAQFHNVKMGIIVLIS